MAKTFKFKRARRPGVGISSPSHPQLAGEAQEPLAGMVNGMQASANEEYLAWAFGKAKIPFIFRYVSGAPKGLPGWKELDFIAQDSGIVYLLEMDTAFTHRTKEQKDILHDAILLNDKEIQTLGTIWPAVIHVDGDSESNSRTSARAFVKRRFGK